MRRGWMVALAALAIGACAGGQQVRRNPGLISSEELSATSVVTLSAYEAVERLRPTWLRRRSATTLVSGVSPFPGVLLNDHAVPDIDMLKSIRVEELSQIRFINAGDATTRFGTGWVNGLIEITMKSGG